MKSWKSDTWKKGEFRRRWQWTYPQLWNLASCTLIALIVKILFSDVTEEWVNKNANVGYAAMSSKVNIDTILWSVNEVRSCDGESDYTPWKRRNEASITLLIYLVRRRMAVELTTENWSNCWLIEYTWCGRQFRASDFRTRVSLIRHTDPIIETIKHVWNKIPS